jgi:hypothetical protein
MGSTSFHVCIWMARMARHTQSWTRTGLGPGANFLSSSRIWLRSAGRSASEIWVPRSYVIWQGQRLTLLLGGDPCIPCTLPLSVVAANSCASASVEFWRMDIVVVQASFYDAVNNPPRLPLARAD